VRVEHIWTLHERNEAVAMQKQAEKSAKQEDDDVELF